MVDAITEFKPKFKPKFKLVLTANELPQYTEYWTYRLRILPFVDKPVTQTTTNPRSRL
jgi:hypothetical protein